MSNQGVAREAAEEEKKAAPKEKKPRRLVNGTKVAVGIAVFVVVALGGFFAYLVFGTSPDIGDGPKGFVDMIAPDKQTAAPTEEQIRFMEAVKAGGAANDPDIRYLPTPQVANYGDLTIHSPILPRDITEIEFHQASYDTALVLNPLLRIVDAEEVAEKRGTNHIPFEEQPFGDKPLIAEAVSTWRLDSEGDEMTSVDVGARAGTVVYAPVTGTVVKIRTYSLFDLIDDYELHIQSPDHPELDIVVLHIDKLTVEVGDKVVAGCTRIAVVRDIGDVIDNNLSNFTEPPDPGNHCHVQVNDATRKEYGGLVGALDIFNGRGYAR